MKKFTKIIAAAMAAVTIAATASVCASARTLTTGEEITDEVIDRYVDVLKSTGFNENGLISFSDSFGFYPMLYVEKQSIIASERDYKGAMFDCWASKQKEKAARERSGNTSEYRWVTC